MAAKRPTIKEPFNDNKDETTVIMEETKIRKDFPECWIFDVFDAVLVEFPFFFFF